MGEERLGFPLDDGIWWILREMGNYLFASLHSILQWKKHKEAEATSKEVGSRSSKHGKWEIQNPLYPLSPLPPPLTPAQETTKTGEISTCLIIQYDFSYIFRQLLLVDPTDKEEIVMNGRMVMAMNIHREICGAVMGGGVSLEADQVHR